MSTAERKICVGAPGRRDKVHQHLKSGLSVTVVPTSADSSAASAPAPDGSIVAISRALERPGVAVAHTYYEKLRYRLVTGPTCEAK